jgi:CO/xanthine dehydrogenase Mo-binding subunit
LINSPIIFEKYPGLYQAAKESAAPGIRCGLTLNHNFMDYHLPKALDVSSPSVTIIIESNDEFGPFGAKEGSLPVCMNGYCALANAIYDAVQVRIADWPAIPEKILKALEKREMGG